MAVARAHGLDVRQPRVIRDLSNILVHLAPTPVVARVATTTTVVRRDGAREWLARELEVATYLAAQDGAVVPPATELPAGPHIEDGFAITFWRLVEPAPRPPSQAAAASALRGLHDRLRGFAGVLPALDSVLEEARAVIERGALTVLDEPLRAAREAIEDRSLPLRALHGDAHAGNLLDTPSGLLWTDFEDACEGPVEWDLACLVADRGESTEALAAYGYDGGERRLAPFVAARRLQVAAWTALMAEHHPQLRSRADERIAAWNSESA